MRGGLRGALAAALAPLALLLTSCGSPGATRFSVNAQSSPGGSGELAYAIPPLAGQLDPLRADSLAKQTVARQVFEPLVARLDGPYNGSSNTPGLAISWQHSGDLRIWSFRLRAGVRFQDGTALNSGAVLVNVRRWQRSPPGRSLLPSLLGADSPRPGIVRFIFSVPEGGVASRLSDPRLGLVSPSALGPGGGGVLTRAAQAGSGPFQLATRTPGEFDLSRYRGWWGSTFGLGPALDGVAFRQVASESERERLLRSGAVRVASELGAAAARRLAGDPLLTAIPASPGMALGLERSVRGINAVGPMPLSGVWLTLFGQQ